MIDHFSLAVKDYDQSIQFYDQTLKTLGYERVMSFDHKGDLQGLEYHPGYYGAFIIDPNGWRIEACYYGGSSE